MSWRRLMPCRVSVLSATMPLARPTYVIPDKL